MGLAHHRDSPGPHREAGPRDRRGQAVLHLSGLGPAAHHQRGKHFPRHRYARRAHRQRGHQGREYRGARKRGIQASHGDLPHAGKSREDGTLLLQLVSGHRRLQADDRHHGRHPGTRKAHRADQIHLELRGELPDEPARRHQPDAPHPAGRQKVRDHRGHRHDTDAFRPLCGLSAAKLFEP